jgi:hypothetical protein
MARPSTQLCIAVLFFIFRSELSYIRINCDWIREGLLCYSFPIKLNILYYIIQNIFQLRTYCFHAMFTETINNNYESIIRNIARAWQVHIQQLIRIYQYTSTLFSIINNKIKSILIFLS